MPTASEFPQFRNVEHGKAENGGVQKQTAVHDSGGNVFADLGVENSDACRPK
jgi:hypothetical protein